MGDGGSLRAACAAVGLACLHHHGNQYWCHKSLQRVKIMAYSSATLVGSSTVDASQDRSVENGKNDQGEDACVHLTIQWFCGDGLLMNHPLHIPVVRIKLVLEAPRYQRVLGLFVKIRPSPCFQRPRINIWNDHLPSATLQSVCLQLSRHEIAMIGPECRSPHRVLSALRTLNAAETVLSSEPLNSLLPRLWVSSVISKLLFSDTSRSRETSWGTYSALGLYA